MKSKHQRTFTRPTRKKQQQQQAQQQRQTRKQEQQQQQHEEGNCLCQRPMIRKWMETAATKWQWANPLKCTWPYS